MKIWLSKNSEISVREQLVTQIKIGIAGGDLAIGERLPSTTDIARRLKIHANTVSNAYQLLVKENWLEFRKGSGFFVREVKSENSLDKLIGEFFQNAQNIGFTVEEVKQKVAGFAKRTKPKQIFVIEENTDLREIIIEEIRAETSLNVIGGDFKIFHNNSLQDVVFVAMFDEKNKLSNFFQSENNCIFLKFNSAVASMKGEIRPQRDEIIAIASGWKDFLTLAKTMLIAVRIEPECLILRSTHEKKWRDGLNSASMIICDTLTAKKLDRTTQNVRVFPLIAEDSIVNLKKIF